MVLAGIVLLSYLYAIRTLPIGLAYPMVTGLATLGTFFVGSLVFGDAMGARALGGVTLIAARHHPGPAPRNPALLTLRRSRSEPDPANALL